jgi:Uma2 family endonuclease
MSAVSQILEIPEVRARVSPVTVAQYHQFPEFNENGRRTELIRGLVIEKMSKTPLHTGIASELYDIIRPQVPPGFWVRKEEPLTFRDSEPEPDLSVARGTRADFVTHHPSTAALVVEIAVTSAAEDRSLVSLYAEAGVEEYWIVLAAARQMEVYRNPVGSGYSERTLVEVAESLECCSVPGVRVCLADILEFGKR